MTNKKYEVLPFVEKQGYPVGKKYFYRCLKCGDIVTSTPEFFASCSCENVSIDNTCARITIREKDKFEIIKYK
jgi:hypothetical protein